MVSSKTKQKITIKSKVVWWSDAQYPADRFASVWTCLHKIDYVVITRIPEAASLSSHDPECWVHWSDDARELIFGEEKERSCVRRCIRTAKGDAL